MLGLEWDRIIDVLSERPVQWLGLGSHHLWLELDPQILLAGRLGLVDPTVAPELDATNLAAAVVVGVGLVRLPVVLEQAERPIFNLVSPELRLLCLSRPRQWRRCPGQQARGRGLSAS